MIRRVLRRVVAFLGSAGLATVLLVLLGTWSAVATMVPQGTDSTEEVAAWASGHSAIEPVVRVLGLHQAFSSPLLLALVVILGASVALCAWQRTKLALHRARMLQDAKQLDTRSLAETHDFEIACDPKLSAPDALSIVSRTLTLLGVRTKYHDDSVVAVSGRWTVWGSPVFHWALLGLLLSLLVGNMLRSEGLMGVIVGQTAADVPESYGVLHTGPLHDWGGVHRSIRVDGFELGYTTGGVDRGPTPTVSLLDGSGAVVQTQRVYPNMTLKNGSLTIYPSSYGLAVLASEVDSSGAVVGSGHQLADFSEQAAGGTVAAGSIALLSASGATVYSAALTVPLDQRDGAWLDRIPDNPSARVLVTSRDGATVLDHVVRVGETLAVPGSLSLRLDGIVYYARLQVVDDWTIPLLYAGLFVALVGLSIATLARQQIVLVTAVKGPSGVRIVAKVRLWRNSSSSRREIESELGQALGEPENRSTL